MLDEKTFIPTVFSRAIVRTQCRSFMFLHLSVGDGGTGAVTSEYLKKYFPKVGRLELICWSIKNSFTQTISDYSPGLVPILPIAPSDVYLGCSCSVVQTCSLKLSVVELIRRASEVWRYLYATLLSTGWPCAKQSVSFWKKTKLSCWSSQLHSVSNLLLHSL